MNYKFTPLYDKGDVGVFGFQREEKVKKIKKSLTYRGRFV